MKNAPCARLGIRIRPKMSEKPDDNRNSRPPKATLLSVWMIQNCTASFSFCWLSASPAHHVVIAGLDTASRVARLASLNTAELGQARVPVQSIFFEKMDPRVKPGGDGVDRGLLLEILCRRVVARIDRVLQELVLLVGPELADVGIGLDHLVDVSPILLLDLADVD